MKNCTLLCLFLFCLANPFKYVKAQCAVKIAGESCAGNTVYAYMPDGEISSLTWFYEGAPVFTQPGVYDQNGKTVISGNGLNGITGIINEGSNIYVNDWYNHRIVKFSYGSSAGQVVAYAKENKYDIYDFCVRDDTVYIAENYNIIVPGDTPYYVTKWIPGAAEGIAVAGMGSPIRLYKNVKTVFIDKEGFLYMGDTHGSGFGRVIKFVPGSGSYNVVVGGFSDANTFLKTNFDDLQVDDDGAVYLLFRDSGYIKKWPPGIKTGIVAARGRQLNPMNSYYSRSSFYIDGNKDIYCTESEDPGPFGRIIGSQRVVKYVPGSVDGTVLIGDDGKHLSSSSGIFTDKNGNIYVGDFELNTIQQFLPAKKIYTGYTPTIEGNYSVQVQSMASCTASANLIVDITASLPYINGPRFVCPGEKGVIFSVANPEPKTLYKWYIDPVFGTITTGQGTRSVKVDWGNKYYGLIKVTAYTHCGPSPQGGTFVTCYDIAGKPSFNKSSDRASVHVYPNPVQDVLQIAWNVQKTGSYTLLLRDITGKTLISRQGKCIPGVNKTMLDMAYLTKGVYMLTIICDGNSTYTTKIVKQ